MIERDTIAAIATAPGRGGVGIVRISGPAARDIGERICGKTLRPRLATYAFFHAGQILVDEGIALLFCTPASFTGEDVVELQGHGGPFVMQQLLQAVLSAGARLARPGEFSERAFLNGKMDLAQAEAVADLIEAGSARAARNALQSMQGVFSREVNQVSEAMLQLRLYVEAAIDFPEEEIDFLADGKVAARLQDIRGQLADLLHRAHQGALVREGIRVVIAGKPNAGKSSLLNALAGRETAIVTDVAGTTRDVLREQVNLDGLPLHIIDTAGLRESDDPVEQEGIRRAWQEIQQADLVLLVVDSSCEQETDPVMLWQGMTRQPLPAVRTLVLHNKIDQSGLVAGVEHSVVRLSARTGQGIESLVDVLKNLAGMETAVEGVFSARARHVDALRQVSACLEVAAASFIHTGAGELLAEDLRRAGDHLGEITGHVSSDELLGKIFASFCIGK